MTTKKKSGKVKPSTKKNEEKKSSVNKSSVNKSASIVTITKVPDKDTEKEFQRAITLQQSEKYDRAASIYQHILMADPTHIGSMMNLGAIRYAEGKDEIALQMFDVVVELQPRNGDAWYNRGKVLLALSQTVDAIKSFEEALALSPSDAPTLTEYGSACIQGNEHNRFLKYLENNGENILRNCGEIRLLEAEAYLKSGSFEKSAAILRKLVDSTPGNAAAFELLSKVYFSCRDFDRAATAIKRALMIEPDSASCHRELGIILAISGHSSEADESFKEADRLDPYNETVRKGKKVRSPGSMEHWDELALHMYLMERMRYWAIRGEWRGAVNELIVLNKKYPGKNCILQELASAYQLNGEPRRARKLYQQLLQRDTSNLEVQLQMSEIALELDETDEALELTRNIVATYPNLVTGLLLRGRALLAAKKKNTTNAAVSSTLAAASTKSVPSRPSSGKVEKIKTVSSPEDCFLKALQVMPASIEAMERLGEIYVAQERYGEAVSILEKSVSGRLSGFASLHCLRLFAKACKGAGELKKLQHVLEQATKMTPDSIFTLIELARIFVKLDMLDKAGSVYTSILSLEQETGSEALCHLEAQLFCRNDKEVKHLLHSHKKSFSKLPEAMLFGALYSFLHCNASTNSIGWQRLWSAIDSETIGEWKEYIVAIMDVGERNLMLKDLRNTAHLFRRSDGIKTRAIAELAAELERTIT